ncbi:MAG TPA: imidazole glycerol phosphate synthase subunit HisH [Actinomycetota bacterium]|nr:imidazole glycerol phosphate synthase subunit HisH [Actinomycetota bacterium]
MPTIAVLDYGSGNLHSVSRALAHAGGEPRVTGEPGQVAEADALVIPGVGHFGHCVRAIRAAGLDRAIADAVDAGVPVFGVCVGMQVLFERSDEDPDEGLGILPGGSRRLPHDVKVPHIGWNEVAWRRAHPYVEGIVDGTRFYFVHSFAPDVDDDAVGVTKHGRPFAAAAARENVFATQFHPEKSGAAGLAIYANFVSSIRARVPA